MLAIVRIMRGAAAGWVLLYGPLFAIAAAAISYKLFGVTGDPLIATAFVVEAFALGLGLKGIGLSIRTSAGVAVASAAATIVVFLLWASTVRI
jgi:hypothetical protein